MIRDLIEYFELKEMVLRVQLGALSAYYEKKDASNCNKEL